MMWNPCRAPRDAAPANRSKPAGRGRRIAQRLADLVAFDSADDRPAKQLRLEAFEARLMLSSTPSLGEYLDQQAAVGQPHAAAAPDVVFGALPPSVPAGLAITEALNGNNINLALTWAASTDPTSGVKNYKVYRNNTLIGSPTTTTFTDNAVSAAATLEYRVAAVNNDNLESDRSEPIFVAQLQNGVSQSGAYNGNLDTWIDENAKTTQNGDATTVRVDGADPLEEMILIRWNLSSIPANAFVRRSSVIVNVTDHSAGQNYGIYQLKRDWVENQATFERPSLADDWQTDGARGANDRGTASLGTIGLANMTLPARRTYPLNAAGTTMVDDWIGGATPNYGFIIAKPTTPTVDNGLLFSSSEATDSGLRPLLMVVYTTPPASDPTPPTAPGGLIGTDNGASRVTLSWTASTDPDSGIDHYIVYRDNVQVGTSIGASFTDTGAIPGVSHTYEVSAVNGSNVEGPRSAGLPYSIAVPMAGRTIEMQTRDSYLPGVPVLVRVEIHDASGEVDRSLWDAAVSISSSNPSVTLSESRVFLKNGLGSILVTPTGSGQFTLNVHVGATTVGKDLVDLSGAPQTTVSGTLTGTESTWSGIVHVTDNVIVPVGHTLTIDPGTLILIDGNPALESQDGKSITVRGTIHSQGTPNSPVTFTASNPTAPWGQLFHDNASASDYTYTDISRAGHSPDQGHTSTGPALRSSNSAITFDHANITDIAGKIGFINGGAASSLTFRDSLFSRAVMGPEFQNSALLMEDQWSIDMLARYREDSVADDDDGIYIHQQLAGQTIRLSRVVFAHGEDDAIDTLGSTVSIEDAIIRDWNSELDDSKGISISGGSVTVRRSLVVNNTLGIAAKALGMPSSVNFIDRTTIVDNPVGIERTEAATVTFNITNSIIRASSDAIFDGGQPGSITVTYSNLSDVQAGVGNQTADPQLVDPSRHDYHLQPTSPAIDAGDPAASFDPDGSRADMGAFPFTHAPPPQFSIKHTPYLQLGNAPLNGLAGSESDQVELLWQTETTGPGTDTFIAEYRQLGSIIWLPAAPITQINTGVGTRINHSALIDGLLFDNDYEYRLRQISSGVVVATYQTTFHTRMQAGNPESFSFVAYGDSASGVPPTDFIAVQNRINTVNPAFSLLLGDNAYGAAGSDSSTWGSHESQDMRFDPTINAATPTFISQHVEYPAVGNADLATANGQATRDNFAVPLNGPTDTAASGSYFADRPESNYSFDYGEVHFATFDSDSFFGTPSEPARFTEQLAWIVADMQAAKTQWKVVYTHFPAIATDASILASSPYYQQLVTALRGAGVDLLLAGHSHTYQRSYPLTGESGGNATFVLDTDNNYAKGAGLVQMIVGTGGRSLNGGATAPHLAKAMTSQTTPASEFGFAKFDVLGNVLNVSFVAADDGASLDTFSITAPAPITTPLQTLPLGETVWTAAAGPRRVTGNITIPVGATLRIEPGVDVSFAAGVGLIVNGRLVAEGTPYQRISLSAPAGSTTAWAGIRFVDTMQDNRLAYIDMGDALSRSDAISIVRSKLLIDHVVWSDINGNVLDLDEVALMVSNSVFPQVDGGEPIESNGGVPEWGYFILAGNIFGRSLGNSDTVDFEGGHRTGRPVQVYGNIFYGGPDEALDFDVDAHIEGNVFMSNLEALGPPEPNGTTSSISTGPFLEDPNDPNVDEVPSLVTVTRNLFFMVDRAMGIKQGTFVNFTNNTVVGVTVDALNFYDPSRQTDPGRGAYVDGNIFWDVNELFGHVNESQAGPNTVVTQLTMNRTLIDNTLPAATIAQLLALGVGNLSGNPLFVNPESDFHLLPGSPAIGTGPGGNDMGAYTPATPARVTGVKVRGANWSPAMLARLQADGAGTGGYNLPTAAGGAVADTIPWGGVSEITLSFSEGVVVQSSSLAVHGVNVADYPIASFAFDLLTNTATWKLATPIAADKIRLVLADSVTDFIGSPLDGEAGASYPSGNSAPGGDFELRFNVLPGDNNKSGAVDQADVVAAIRGAFVSSTAPEYVAAQDINADGKVSIVDAIFTRNQLASPLPAGEPGHSPEAPAALVARTSANARSPAIVASASASLHSSRQRVRASAVDELLGAANVSTRTLRATRSRTITARAVDSTFGD